MSTQWGSGRPAADALFKAKGEEHEPSNGPFFMTDKLANVLWERDEKETVRQFSRVEGGRGLASRPGGDGRLTDDELVLDDRLERAEEQAIPMRRRKHLGRFRSTKLDLDVGASPTRRIWMA